MKRIILGVFLCLLLNSQSAFASGHFMYLVQEDGVYAGAYYQFKKIKEADPLTFRPVGGLPSPYGMIETYAVDKNHVYYYSTILSEMDPATLEVLLYPYIKDKKGVYFYNVNTGRHEMLKGIDSASVEMIRIGKEYKEIQYIKDKDAVYYIYQRVLPVKIAGADAATFESIPETLYAKDKEHVYYLLDDKLMMIEGSDPAIFETPIVY